MVPPVAMILIFGFWANVKAETSRATPRRIENF
jgi:hypothetical protein